MASRPDILRLCRLCLMKDKVNIPIFEDVNDISQIFLKISACLHLKVFRNDGLPKKICDNCSYKLGVFYEFLNTCTASEKQLLAWLNQLNTEKPVSKVVSTLTSSHITNVNPVILKQEVSELLDVPSIDELSPSCDLNLPSEAQEYVLQQQHIPYDPVAFEFQQDEFADGRATNGADGLTTNNAVTIGSSYKRGSAVLKVVPNNFGPEDDELTIIASKIAKTETGNGSDNNQMPVVDLPSTSGDNNQPGPSGLGKGDGDAPLVELYTNKINENLSTNCIASSDFLDFQNINLFLLESKSAQALHNNDLISNKSEPEYGLGPHRFIKLFDCDKCSNAFETWEDFKVHSLTHSTNDNYMCEYCGITFRYYEMLLQHINEHNKKLFVCEKCGSHFNTKMQFRWHIKFLHKNACWCYLCSQYFESEQAYIQHQTQHQENEHNVDHVCSVCDKNFYYYSSLQKHSLRHLNVKQKQLGNEVFNFKKEKWIFNKKFVLQNTDNSDVDVTKKQSYMCDICGKCLTTKRALYNHRLIHEGVKSFECLVCGKTFMTNKYLNNHALRHFSVKPHECPICAKRFTQRTSLVIHTRLHTGDKPYACSMCSRRFTSRHLLSEHNRKGHRVIKSLE